MTVEAASGDDLLPAVDEHGDAEDEAHEERAPGLQVGEELGHACPCAVGYWSRKR